MGKFLAKFFFASWSLYFKGCEMSLENIGYLIRHWSALSFLLREYIKKNVDRGFTLQNTHL